MSITPLEEVCRQLKIHTLAYQHLTNADTRLMLQIKAIRRRTGQETAKVRHASNGYTSRPHKAPADQRPPADPLEIETLIDVQKYLTAGRMIIHQGRLEHQHILELQAKYLDAWPWVESIRGFGIMNFATIVGETTTMSLDGVVRHLSHYPTPAAVWKRMGIGLVGNSIQRRISSRGKRGREKTDAQMLAEAHGFRPRRRALMHVIGDSLIKGNHAEDGTPGRYYAMYLARKVVESEKAPGERSMILHKRAMRYMEKQLLKHLWQQWRAAYRLELSA